MTMAVANMDTDADATHVHPYANTLRVGRRCTCQSNCKNRNDQLFHEFLHCRG